MNVYFTLRTRFFVILFILCGINNAFAQCGFQANQYTGCAGTFALDVQDTTSGIRPNSTNWTVTLPGGTVIHGYNNRQFTYPMNIPGTVCITMTDTLSNGQPCSTSQCNVTVYPNPVLKGAFSTNVTCVGDCVYWRDSSIAGTGCSPLSYLIDWGPSPFDSAAGLCRKFLLNGTYSPVIYITNACGCRFDTTFAHAITVTAPPPAAFSGGPLSSCTSPLLGTFSATTPAANTRYSWYITPTGTGFTGGPVQATGSSVFTHSYPAGTYDIKLITLDTLSGCSDTVVKTAYVNAGSNPSACFFANDTTGCDQRTVTFTPCTNGAVKYVWNFTGGPPGAITPNTITSTTNNAQNVFFNAPGAFTAQLIVYYSGGCTDTLTKTNYINFDSIYNLAFVAPDSFSCLIPDTICVNYTGQACVGCTFQWNPPGNTTPTSPSGTCYPVSAYGRYTPLLTVTGPNGCVVSLIKNNYINVQPLVPCVNISYANGNGCANDTVLVTNCTTGGPFSSVIWNFPGANIISQNNNVAMVTYSGTGCNKFTMIVKTLSGCIDTLRDSICIGAKPAVTMSVSPHDLCFESMPNLFTLTGVLSSDSPTSIIIWPEGIKIGAPYITLNALDSFKQNYTYPDFGNFAFCFLAKNLGCNGDTTCLTSSADSVHIFPPAAKLSPVPVCHSTDSITFLNLSTGADSTVWNYNGNTYPNLPALTVVFPQCGVKYGVSLTAFNDTTGCKLTVYDTLAIPCYGVDFKFAKTTGCYYAFDTQANIFTTIATAMVPTNVVWSVQPTGTPPVFLTTSLKGDTVPRYPLYQDGQYDACVQLTYANGCVDVLCKPKYIDISQPTAAFNVSDSAGCVPFCVTFTTTSTDISGAIAHYYWNFGDSANRVDSFTTAVNPVHCFDTIGRFQVCLTVVDTNGCSSSVCRQIQANSIHANFTETDSVTCTTNPSPLNPLTFTNTSTGFISTYSWILPSSLGPVPPTAAPNTPSITEQFSNQGYDSVGLVAVDQFGTCRDTVWKPVHVANPIANYGLPNLNDTLFACPPAVINPFIDSSKNNICQCFWDFGDGLHTDTSCNASIIYTLPGNYCVKHVVTTCHGCADSVTKYCIDIKGPVVKMKASTTGGCPCLPVTFIIESIGADSLQFTANVSASGNIHPGVGQSFINFGVSPRGTPGNPTYDTLIITYCGSGVAIPLIEAIDTRTNCQVRYDSLVTPIAVDSAGVDFSYQVYNCGADSVCFTNLTTFAASPYAYDSINLWNFGDNTASNNANPCHKYATPGDYTVKLTVTDNYGCVDSVIKHIHVPAAPHAKFTVNDTLTCVPFTVQFMDSSVVDDSTSIVNGLWSFGNGVVYNTTNDTNYNYTVAGVYNTMLVIIDGYGCTDTARQVINIQPPPTIHAGPDTVICIGDTVTLSGSGSSTLLWLTHYNISDTNSANPRVWPKVDTFYILRVGALTGCYVYDTVYIKVSTITITLDTATNVCRNQLTSFTASAQTTHATISNYTWAFGDASGRSIGQTVTHQYSTYGSYSDTLIVTNTIGCKDTQVNPLQIFDIPHAALTVSDTVVCQGAPITATNTSTAGVSAALLSFYIDIQPDGIPDDSTMINPYTYTYTSPGSYHLLLVQTDQNHCIDSAEKAIYVHAIPQANFNNDTSCVNVYNTYTSSTVLGDGQIVSYNWTINGIGQGIDSAIIHHTFPDSSNNVVCLNVSDVYGCKDTICKNVAIFPSPTITVTPLDTTICVGYSDTFRISGSRFDHVQWVPSAWVSDPTGTTVVITPRQSISYQVYGYYLQCQPAIDTVTIWVIDTVPVSATADPENIVLGLSSNVTTKVQGTIDSIVWTPDSTLNCRNCRNPIATPHQTTTYYATIYYSKNGVVCSNSTSVTITVFQSCDNSLIYVPNTFTPNGDNKNDVFRLRGIGIAQVNYFRVYDRWGKLVYEADNVTDPDQAAWNGCLNNDQGKPENSGVYTYVFEIQCVTGQAVTGKGNVTLLR